MAIIEVGVFGLSSNPAGIHHRELAARLAKEFDHLIIFPCGPNRTDGNKGIIDFVSPIHRAATTQMTFRDIAPNITIDLSDLERGKFTRTHEVEALMRKNHSFCNSLARIWHVIGGDWIIGGATGNSPIQTEWEHGPEMWEQFNFLILVRDGAHYDPKDLPPHARVVDYGIEGSSTEIRNKRISGEPFEHLVVPEVADYIKRYMLYTGVPSPAKTSIRGHNPRVRLLVDTENPKALEFAAQLAFNSRMDIATEEDPAFNFYAVLGGDGFMLQMVREHWSERIPFIGINMGHYGALLNDRKVVDRPSFFHGKFTSYLMPLLWIEAELSNGEIVHAYALNDAWIERASGQTGHFQLSIDGTVQVQKIVADMLLLSTPTGSTAYWRNMGGSPFSWGSAQIGLHGSNVDADANFRAMTLPDTTVFGIANLDPVKRPLRAVVDGVDLGEVRKITVRSSRIAAAELLFVENEGSATAIEERILRAQLPNTSRY